MSAGPDDLLSKADALMARHFPGRTPAVPYAEIPVLDEVVGFIPEGDGLPLLTEYVVQAPPDKEQIEALAASIRAALLLELQDSVDALIDERLIRSLEPLMEDLFNSLRGELQIIARDTLRTAIDAAVVQEIERRESGS